MKKHELPRYDVYTNWLRRLLMQAELRHCRDMLTGFKLVLDRIEEQSTAAVTGFFPAEHYLVAKSAERTCARARSQPRTTLCVAGYAVHVYEMTDRLGGMMIRGIPAFRLPPGIIDEDVDRLMQRCPGLEVHLDTALGRDVSLGELKERHDAVLLTIGAWWGKPMGSPRPWL